MTNFIMMDNDTLTNTDKFNTFEKIGTEGFALYCYLLTQQGQKTYSQITIKMISTFMDREVDKPKELIYNKNKVCNVGKLKSKKMIIRYLNLLNEYKLIIFDKSINYGINSIIIIKTVRVTDEQIEEYGFTMISEELFVDYIHKIGHIGWSLLYILTRLHNDGYGSISCEGFANPSEEYLKSIIKKDVKTISAYLYMLKKYKLITIEKNAPVFKGKNNHGVEIFDFIPNNYVVKNRLVDTKYYIEKIDKKEEEK